MTTNTNVNCILRTIILFSIPLLAFLTSSCTKDAPKDTITPPAPTICEYPPGNRSFTWRMDTVAWWPSTLGGIHAFSDSDAWVMGNMVGQTTSYAAIHWDGHAWNEKVGFFNVYIKTNDVCGDDKMMVGAGYFQYPGQLLGVVTEFDNEKKSFKTTKFNTLGELRSVWTDKKGFFIAVGDSGMVFTKDGYSSEWVKIDPPTGFSFFEVKGISKSEIYIRADSLSSNGKNQQIWALNNSTWKKLFDSNDSVNSAIRLSTYKEHISGISAFRCSITDSLYLYLVGDRAYRFVTNGNSHQFKRVNLATEGYPLPGSKATLRLTVFSPNDIWFISNSYDIYHWNGTNFQKIEPIKNLPYGSLWGITKQIVKNNSGNIWMLLETDSQVFTILQGTPK